MYGIRPTVGVSYLYSYFSLVSVMALNLSLIIILAFKLPVSIVNFITCPIYLFLYFVFNKNGLTVHVLSLPVVIVLVVNEAVIFFLILNLHACIV